MQKLVGTSKFIGVLCFFFGLPYVFQLIELLMDHSQTVSTSFYIEDIAIGAAFFFAAWVLYVFLPNKYKSKIDPASRVAIEQAKHDKKWSNILLSVGIIGFAGTFVVVFGDLFSHIDSGGAYFSADNAINIIVFAFVFAISFVVTGIALRLKSR